MMFTLALPFILAAQSGGPSNGSLIVIGGGPIGPGIVDRFIRLAGGKDAPFVAIPSAGDPDEYSPDWKGMDFLKDAGCTKITVLHTRDRAVANSDSFVQPLRTARGVFFGGGRQWRLVDAYAGTLAEREIAGVLDRGGVIAGSSAGASIQASFLVRGAREGNTIMIAPAYMRGFGYLRGVAVDQHLLKRKRENDLLQVIDRYPALLGIGIDEGTAIVVQSDQFEVIGCSMVAIYDHRYVPKPGQPRYYFLTPGARFDLGARRVLP
jgi:cyanophycinase